MATEDSEVSVVPDLHDCIRPYSKELFQKTYSFHDECHVSELKPLADPCSNERHLFDHSDTAAFSSAAGSSAAEGSWKPEVRMTGAQRSHSSGWSWSCPTCVL